MSARNLESPPPSDNGMPTEAANRQEVYSFQKNSSERVVASLSRYHGELYIDIRAFYSDGVQWRPTKKGLTIAPDLIDDLEEALRRLRAALGIPARGP